MNFGGSDSKIYGAMQKGGLLKNWSKEDWYSILSGIQASGRFAWSAEKMKLTNPNPLIAHAETPWCHAKHCPRKNCAMDHHVLFNGFGIIHPRCLECWKVVASPNNFDELIQVERLQRALDIPCKAGIELRDYTPRHYGSYYYCHSVEEGRERYKQVRELMDEINPDIDVILKRGCTEYEMVKGPSVFWHITDEQLEFAENVEHFVTVPENDNDQPQLMKRHVRCKWALWAHANGDMSYKKYNGDLELFPKCVTYHKGDLADVVHDIALGHAHAKSGMDAKFTDEFLTTVVDWSAENGIDPSKLGAALGHHGINPLNLKSMLQKDTPEGLIGEDDEAS
jgi:hypothetical protein